jgi:lipopolysaccharide/colanic/teichoic acid biosynthesis glycosyltransferase
VFCARVAPLSFQGLFLCAGPRGRKTGYVVAVRERETRRVPGYELRAARQSRACNEPYDSPTRVSTQLRAPTASERAAVSDPWKRGVDLVIAAVGLVLAVPVLALLAFVVLLDSGGPVIFRQKRVGLCGTPFYIYKIRTMRHRGDEEGLGPEARTAEGIVLKESDDPRRTRAGRFLRKYSLDELPQLLNVLRGEMSLVGPRPLVWGEVDMDDPRHQRRLEALPGLTGLWQISGRNKIDRDGHIRLDLEYLDRRSFWFDLWILIRTIPAVISADGAI